MDVADPKGFRLTHCNTISYPEHDSFYIEASGRRLERTSTHAPENTRPQEEVQSAVHTLYLHLATCSDSLNMSVLAIARAGCE